MESCQRIKIYNKNHLAREIATRLKHFFGGLSTESLSYQVEKAVIEDRSYYYTHDRGDDIYTEQEYALLGLDEEYGSLRFRN